MSNKIQLQTNNSNLDALITRVNAAKDTAASLPEAGEGSGGIETCTCMIVPGANATIVYNTLDSSGNITAVSTPGSYFPDLTIVCGTSISIIYDIDTSIFSPTTAGCSLLGITNYAFNFLVTASAGESARIIISTGGQQ